MLDYLPEKSVAYLSREAVGDLVHEASVKMPDGIQKIIRYSVIGSGEEGEYPRLTDKVIVWEGPPRDLTWIRKVRWSTREEQCMAAKENQKRIMGQEGAQGKVARVWADLKEGCGAVEFVKPYNGVHGSYPGELYFGNEVLAIDFVKMVLENIPVSDGGCLLDHVVIVDSVRPGYRGVFGYTRQILFKSDGGIKAFEDWVDKYLEERLKDTKEVANGFGFNRG